MISWPERFLVMTVWVMNIIIVKNVTTYITPTSIYQDDMVLDGFLKFLMHCFLEDEPFIGLLCWFFSCRALGSVLVFDCEELNEPPQKTFQPQPASVPVSGSKFFITFH